MSFQSAIVSASSHHNDANWTKPDRLVDNDFSTLWIVDKSHKNSYAYILIQLPTPAHIYRCDLHPRPKPQQFTHALTHYILEGSLDNKNYNKIFESRDIVDRERIFEFSIQPPYKFFKLTCTGKQQFGLSEILLYEATSKQEESKNAIQTNVVNTKHLRADSISTVGLIIDQGKPSEIRIGNKLISGIVAPVEDNQVANKIYVDDINRRMGAYVNEQLKAPATFLSYADSFIFSPYSALNLHPIYNNIAEYRNGYLFFKNDYIIEINIRIQTLNDKPPKNIVYYVNETRIPLHFKEKEIDFFIVQSVKKNDTFHVLSQRPVQAKVFLKLTGHAMPGRESLVRTPATKNTHAELVFLSLYKTPSHVPDQSTFDGEVIVNELGAYRSGELVLLKDGTVDTILTFIWVDASQKQKFTLEQQRAGKIVKKYSTVLNIEEQSHVFTEKFEAKKDDSLRVYVEQATDQIECLIKFKLTKRLLHLPNY